MQCCLRFCTSLLRVTTQDECGMFLLVQQVFVILDIIRTPNPLFEASCLPITIKCVLVSDMVSNIGSEAVNQRVLNRQVIIGTLEFVRQGGFRGKFCSFLHFLIVCLIRVLRILAEGYQTRGSCGHQFFGQEGCWLLNAMASTNYHKNIWLIMTPMT